MSRTCYSVERLQGKWVILVSGAKLLTCQKRSVALAAVRRARASLFSPNGIVDGTAQGSMSADQQITQPQIVKGGSH
jgi:hypothetical protein